MTAVTIDGRRVRLSNLDRVLWPEAGFTKRDLVHYYVAVAPVLLPHIAGRPLTLWRFPQGVHERGWWQNECRGSPEWMRTATVRGQRFCVADDAASLAWLANMGTVELHPFLALASAPDEPTGLVFDLDPGPPADVVDCCRVALRLRDALADRGLAAFAKTSGSVGLHVHVPLAPHHTFGETKSFARKLAEQLADSEPAGVTVAQQKVLRAGRVLIDWLQNDPARSTVAPYSLRATPYPTVAMPVTWDEVERTVGAPRAERLTFLARDVFARIEQIGDVMAASLSGDQRLPS